MAFTSPKAKKGTKPDTNPKADMTYSGTQESNQERFTDKGSKPGRVGGGVSGSRYMETDRELSNQVRVGPNTKGTGVLKDPLNSYKVYTLDPVLNPDPKKFSR